jgi:hypothetical protein
MEKNQRSTNAKRGNASGPSVKNKIVGHAMIERKRKCHPRTLAPANDQLQSRPATVYEDKAK